jgi:hypothetical protein
MTTRPGKLKLIGEIMENQIADSQQDRISVMKTVFESAIGRNLVEAAQNLLSDQAGFFDGVARFEILSAAVSLLLFLSRSPAMKANYGKSGNLKFSPTQMACSVRRAVLSGHLALKACTLSAAVQNEDAYPQTAGAREPVWTLPRLLRAGSSCAQQNAAAGTNRRRNPDVLSPLESLQILAAGNEWGNRTAHLTEAGGDVVPTDLERSAVKIEFFNFGIHGRAVRRARDQHGRLRLARPDGFAGVRPPAKQ